ncbi:MAG: hypothetical protein K2N48_02750 [Muribaculaceae bacterium]|nr:hypothetical protein [Muribaculaceae bacterium]
MTPTLKNFLQQFTIALAAISSAVTCIAFLFQNEANEILNSAPRKSIILVTIVILCWIYSCYMNQRKTKVSFNFNPQFKLTVEKGDIFEKKGIVVIPVNEYFDTHVGDGIISPNSVHGKWINKYFSGNIRQLDNLISPKLLGKSHKLKTSRKSGKIQRYKLGTCIDIPIGDITFVLMALTHFDSENHAFLKRADFALVFDKLINHLKSLQIEKPIYMPLIGTGLSRLGRSPQRILNFLVDAIDFKYSELTFPQGIHIEIYDINTVNLNDLKTYVENELTI